MKTFRQVHGIMKGEDIMCDLTTFIRRGQVLEILGVTRYQLECLISSGCVTPILLKGMKQKVFRTKEILEVNYTDIVPVGTPPEDTHVPFTSMVSKEKEPKRFKGPNQVIRQWGGSV